jgi:hypothetical protein
MHPELWAVRTDGSGDVTDTHVTWRVKTRTPKTASPILAYGLIYMVTDDGVATCLEATTGHRIWSKRLPGPFAASPIYAAGTRPNGSRLYFCNQDGQTTVLKPGRHFEILATTTHLTTAAWPRQPSTATPPTCAPQRTCTGLETIRRTAIN